MTLIIGLVAHKNRDRPKPSFYVTDLRMGVDFGLLSADSRPLTAKQLTEVLGRDACYGERKGAYQDAVDARLFGLGRERYTQLLDLLIALRRPLLAKDLDPVKVSDTLTNGLSPVDEELLEQAARDFENLAAVQKQYDDLAAADSAITAFLEHYVTYLRVHARHQLDQVDARITAAASHVAAITAAASEVSRAEQAEQATGQAAEAAGITAQTLEAQVFALKNRDAYKDHEKLALRRAQLEKDSLSAGRRRAPAGPGPEHGHRPAARSRRRGRQAGRAGPGGRSGTPGTWPRPPKRPAWPRTASQPTLATTSRSPPRPGSPSARPTWPRSGRCCPRSATPSATGRRRVGGRRRPGSAGQPGARLRHGRAPADRGPGGGRRPATRLGQPVGRGRQANPGHQPTSPHRPAGGAVTPSRWR